MNKTIFAACGAVAIAGITASAQTPGGTTPATQTRSQDGATTLTGCLMTWNGSTTPGTTGSSTTMQYILTDVEGKASMDAHSRPGTTPSATGTTPATPGTTPASPGSTASTPPRGSAAGAMEHRGEGDERYLLRAEGTTVKLAAHVNHKVELTGRVIKSPEGTAGNMGTRSTASTSGRQGETMEAKDQTSDATMPTFTVTAVKMVAATCK